MLKNILHLAKSPLRLFLSNSYSLELLFILKKNKISTGIEASYELLVSPKPRLRAFNEFIRELLAAGLIVLEVGSDKRKKNIMLSDYSKKELKKKIL